VELRTLDQEVVTPALPLATRLLSLSTAVPPFALQQSEVARAARTLFRNRAGRELEYLLPVFEHAGIETRYSCVPLEWYLEPHDWKERNDLYVENAVDLLVKSGQAAIAEARLTPRDIDTIVTVSTTGVATPSLDARLVGRLGLRGDVERLPVFGLGCAGGVLGLARAAALAQSKPGSRVLFLVTELCALTFRESDISNANIVATALFGDGAAGAVLTHGGDGAPDGGAAILSWGEHLWPDSLNVMGWDVGGDGLGVIFSQSIPDIVAQDMRGAAQAFLARQSMALDDLEGFVCHPGGEKVVAALEKAFGLPPGGMPVAREVLRNYGNMSAVTVLFVLERVLKGGAKGRHLMSALGPGFTAAFALLDLQ